MGSGLSPCPRRHSLFCCPAEPATPQQITHDSLYHSWARWLPDSQGHCLHRQAGRSRRAHLFCRSRSTASATPISPEGIDPLVLALAPDGSQVAGVGSDGNAYLYSLTGGPTKAVSGFLPSEQPIEWSADGKSLYVYQPASFPPRSISSIWPPVNEPYGAALAPADPAGVSQIGPIVMTPDGTSYIYGYHRTLSDLYLVEGLK